MNPPDRREAVRLLRTMTWVLSAVGALALAFTTVNVTLFARTKGVPLPIAILLDPMLGAALAVVLYADARLAAWGVSPPGWSTALRWSAGSTAALMNSWESLWPDGQIGWPRRADPAAVLLHLTPALLLILLTETIAAYRRVIADLPDPTGSTDPLQPPPLRPSATSDHVPDAPPHPPANTSETLPATGAPHTDTQAPATVGDSATYTAGAPHTAPDPDPSPDIAADAELWARATVLDDTVQTTTGQPASVWRLRTELRIGPRRAQQIHSRLAARRAAAPLA